MKRVILAEPTQLNVSTAAQHGELVYLSKTPINPFHARTPELLRQQLVDIKYDPATDSVCTTGSLITIAMLLAITAQYGPVRLLMFDAKGSFYRERIFSILGSSEDGQANQKVISAA